MAQADGVTNSDLEHIGFTRIIGNWDPVRGVKAGQWHIETWESDGVRHWYAVRDRESKEIWPVPRTIGEVEELVRRVGDECCV